MAISFINASANAAAASGNLTVTPPTTQTDDIMILAVSSHDNVAISLPAGWTIIDQSNNGTGLRATTAWKRCVGAEGAFTVTHTAGNGIVANVAVYRGCSTGSNVINANLLTNNASSSTCTANSITPTVDNCMLIFTMHDSDNGASSAQDFATSPATITERFDNSSSLGLDQAVSLADGLQTTASASGNATGTLSLGPDVNTGTAIALRPQVTTTRTQTGVARITVTTTRTQTGAGRIQVTTTRTQAGVARVTATTTRTQAGVARIQATATRTQTGKGDIRATTTRTQTGVANITGGVTTTRTQTGVARITATTTRTQTGKGAVRNTTTRTQVGIARMRVTVTRTQSGTARVTATATRTQTGRGNIRATTTRTQTGVANISGGFTTRTQTGRAAIRGVTSRYQQGRARITLPAADAIAIIRALLPINFVELNDIVTDGYRRSMIPGAWVKFEAEFDAWVAESPVPVTGQDVATRLKEKCTNAFMSQPQFDSLMDAWRRTAPQGTFAECLRDLLDAISEP